MNFFNLDGPFHKYGTILFDLVMLNLLWLFISVFSIGILAGPATVALYFSIYHCVIKQSGTPLKTFFVTLKNKFKVSILTWLVVLFMSGTCVASLYWISIGFMPKWLYPLYFALLLYIILVAPFGIGLIAETDFKFKAIFKYSVLLAIKHLPYAILVLLITAGGLALIYMQPITILIIGSLVALGQSFFVSEKVYARYDFDDFEENK